MLPPAARTYNEAEAAFEDQSGHDPARRRNRVELILAANFSKSPKRSIAQNCSDYDFRRSCPNLNRPKATNDEAITTIALPYGMTAEGVVMVINDVDAHLHVLNKASIEHSYNRLEDRASSQLAAAGVKPDHRLT